MIYPCMSMLLFIYLLKDIWSTFKFSYTPHAETPKEYSCTCFCVFRWKCFINVSEKLNFDLCYHKTIQKTDIMGFLFLCTFGSWKTSPLSSWVPSSTPRSPSRCRLDCTPYFLLVLGDSIFSKLDGDKKKKNVFTNSPKNELGPVLQGGWGSRNGQKAVSSTVTFMELRIQVVKDKDVP